MAPFAGNSKDSRLGAPQKLDFVGASGNSTLLSPGKLRMKEIGNFRGPNSFDLHSSNQSARIEIFNLLYYIEGNADNNYGCFV